VVDEIRHFGEPTLKNFFKRKRPWGTGLRRRLLHGKAVSFLEENSCREHSDIAKKAGSAKRKG